MGENVSEVYGKLSPEERQELIENFTAGICAVHHEEGVLRYIMVNEVFAEMVGTTRDDLLNERVLDTVDRVYPADRARWLRDVDELMKNGGPVTDCYRYYNSKIGEYVWLRISSKCSKDGYGFVTVTRAGSGLVAGGASDGGPQNILENFLKLPGACVIFYGVSDVLLSVYTMSPDFLDLVGVGAEEAKKMYTTSFDILVQNDREYLKDYYAQHPENGSIEVRLFRKDRNIVWAKVDYSAFYFDDQKYIYALYTDITLLKKTEEKLTETREISDFSLSGSDIFIWQWNLITNEITFGENPYTIKRKKEIGYPDVVPEASKYIMANVMPESKATMQRIIDDVFSGQEQTSGDIRFRAGGNEGYTMCRVSYRVVKDENGHPYKAYGSEQNITDQTILRDNFEREMAKFSGDEDERILFRVRASLTQNRSLELRPYPREFWSVQSYDEIIVNTMPSDILTTDGRTLQQVFNRGEAIARYTNGNRREMIEYRWPGKNGEWRWIKGDIRLLQNPDTSDVEMFLYCLDDTDDRMQKMLMEHLTTDTYDTIAVVNIFDGSYMLHSKDGTMEQEEISYYDYIKELIEKRIPSKEKSRVKKALSDVQIKKELDKRSQYLVRTEEVEEDGSISYKMRQYSWLDPEKTLFMVCVSDISDSVRDEMERVSEEAESRRLYNAFVEGLNRVHDSEIMLDLQENAYYVFQVSRTFPAPERGQYTDLKNTYVKSFGEDKKTREKFAEILSLEYLQKTLNDGSLFETDYRRVLPDGAERWFRFHMAAVLRTKGEKVRYVMIATTDITETVQAQQLLLEKIESDSAIIQKSSMDAYDFIAVIDCDKQMIELKGGSWFNVNVPTPEEMRVIPYTALLNHIANNFSENEEAGKEFYQKFSIDSIREELSTKREVFFPFNFLDADEKKHIKYKQFRFCFLDEEHTRILATRSDVTAAMEKEAEVNLQLKEALDAAEAANSAKSEFLSHMSHDIRTPMNAIIGFSTLLVQNPNNPARVADQSRKILTSSNHLLGIINDVLDMSKIETGKMQANVYEFKLSETIVMLDNIIRPQVKEKEQEFDIRLTGVRHDNFLGDNQRLQQILLNILSNAMKYTPVGGKINMSIRGLSEVSGRYEKIVFVIEDNGRGMTEEYQKIIFEPFSREQLEATDSIQGTGLGMAITKNLVNFMGGTISVKSKLGEGSTFTVMIPLRLVENEEENTFWQDHNLTHMLVVDDEEDICWNIGESMRGTGVRMEYALSGQNAIDKLKKAVEDMDEFHLVLLDWKMPDMDGVETTRAIRKFLPEDTLIIILTAYDYSEIEEEARAAGVNGFMTKPFFAYGLEQAVLSGKPSLTASSEKSDHVPSDIEGLSILAAEDNEMNAEILKELLTMNGADLVIEENGRRVVKAFRESEVGTYDCILMDIRMPVMNGYNASRAIRALANQEGIDPDKQKEAREIPIIAMTANAFSTDVKQSFEAGMNGHVAKPLDMQVLTNAILGSFNHTEEEVVFEPDKGREYEAPDAKVLLVDDTPMNLTVLECLLEDSRVQVDTADGGRSALELCREKEYQLIFMDHRMPDIDGAETYKRIREMEGPNRQTPVVILTADASPDDRDRFLVQGFNGYLAKPVMKDDLEDCLFSLLPKDMLRRREEAEEGAGTAEENPLLRAVREKSSLSVEDGIRAAGSEKTFLDLLGQFSLMAKEGESRIQKAFANKDYKNFTVFTHALKTQARLIGATKLSEDSFELEKAGDALSNGEKLPLEELSVKTRQALLLYDKIARELSEILREYGEAPSDAEPISMEELKELYEAMEEAVTAFDFDTADRLIRMLSGVKVPESETERCRNLAIAVTKLDQEGILALLKES